MIEILLFTATSFGVGLSGALVPGPMLTVTISDSIKKGSMVGTKVVLGHIITEIVIMMAILAGLGWIIGSHAAAFIIGTVGGIVLVFMGYNLLKSSNQLSNTTKDENLPGRNEYSSNGISTRSSSNSKTTDNSIFKGIITSISNPYFFIWWATIGCTFLFKGFELAGILGFLGFIIGHWSADISWYSLISFFTSKGSKIMSNRSYKLITMICGVFLIILGIYFVLIFQINYV